MKNNIHNILILKDIGLCIWLLIDDYVLSMKLEDFALNQIISIWAKVTAEYMMCTYYSGARVCTTHENDQKVRVK